MELILAGDIGGTNTRLALYDANDLREPRVLAVYRSGGLTPRESAELWAR